MRKFTLILSQFILCSLACVSASCAIGTLPARDTFIDNGVKPSRSGEASSATFLGILGGGDAGIKAAMDNGKITKIHHVDHREAQYLFYLLVVNTTIVYGE